MKLCTKRVLLFYTGLFLIILISSSAFSEEQISWEEKYKDQPYLRLLNEMTVRLNKDFTYTETWHFKDKIQNEAGKAQGEVEISYDQKREEIKSIEAHTVRPDGTRIRCDSIQDRNDPNSGDTYTDKRKKIITAPEVVVGNTIDVKIASFHKVPVIERNFYDHFRFSCTCPIKEVRYRLIIPAGMGLNIKILNSGLKPRIEQDGDDVIYTWESFNNAKDEIEEYMPSAEEVFPEIVVTTLGGWEQLSGWFYSLNEKNLKSSPEIRSKVSEITSGKAATGDKIQAIIDYIREDFRYVSMNIENHGYEPHPSDEIFQHKYGDCKDQTLLAIAMLREIGVTARPVLVSTWADLRRMDLLPIPSYFNHVILSFDLDGVTYYTDVLTKGYDFHELPAYLSEKRALSVREKDGGFVVLPPSDARETTNVENTKVIIREDGMAVVETQYIFSRNASTTVREALKNMPQDKKDKFFAAMEAQILSGGKLISRSWQNMENPRKQLIFTISFENPTLVQKMGDFMTFGLDQIPRGSQFSAPRRQLPIVFRSSLKSEEKISYTIPKGFEVVSIPKKVAHHSALRDIEREYSAAGDLVTVSQVSSYNKARISSEEYAQFQKFLDDIPRLTNDKVVIRKKEARENQKLSSVR